MREWFNWLLGVAGFVYSALCLQMIARKTGTRHSWMAWIPVLDFIFGVILCMGIAGARGKPIWLGLLMFVPVVNLAVMGYLAFSNEKTA